MKLRVFVGLCLLGGASLSFAKMPPKPETCPSLSALKGQAFFMAQKPQEAPGFVAISLGRYQTKDNWAFLMAFIEADTMLQAIMTANQYLPNISGAPAPMPIEEQNIWACIYDVDGTPYKAVAVTPLSDSSKAARIMKRI